MAEHASSTPASALLRTVPMSLWPEAVRDRRRRLEVGLSRLEELQAEMIQKLDELTADPDLESTGDDEPSLCGVSAQHIPFTEGWGPYIDLEEQADAEPMLGWSERESLTGRLSCSLYDDEPDHDAEREEGE